MNYDTLIIGFPNKTIEIPPLGSSILQEVLIQNGYTSKQYDMNVILKDLFLEPQNLEIIHSNVLPFLLEQNINNKSTVATIESMFSLLSLLKEEHTFEKVCSIKRKIQNREYSKVFCDNSNSEIYKHLMKLLSFSSFFLKKVIVNSAIEKKFPSLFVFTMVDNLLSTITANKIPIIGVSIVELQRQFSLWAIKRLKTKFMYSGKVFVGGSDLTYFNEYIKYFDFIDYGIYKEGEIAIIKLLDYVIQKKGTLDTIPNLLYMNNGVLMTNPIEEIGDFNLVIPNFEDLPLEKYISHALPIQASRGCSWGKCTYCKHYKTYGKDYYAGNVNSLISQIKVLMARHNTTLFHFVDDDFPIGIKSFFAEEIIKQNINIQWLAYSRFEKKITKDMLELWYKSGLSVIEWGLETASNKVLKKVKKGMKLDTTKRLLHEASDIGFLNKIFMFHNLPEEDFDELWQSVLFLKKYVTKGLVRPFWELLTPMELLVDTPLYNSNFTTEKSLDFKKVFKPRGKLVVQAGYIPNENYNIKKSILSNSLLELKELALKYNILEMDDEAILTDVILEDLRNKKHPIKIHSRIEHAQYSMVQLNGGVS